MADAIDFQRVVDCATKVIDCGRPAGLVDVWERRAPGRGRLQPCQDHVGKGGQGPAGQGDQEVSAAGGEDDRVAACNEAGEKKDSVKEERKTVLHGDSPEKRKEGA